MRVRASSLNYRDLMVLKGGGRGPTKLGVVPLSDGAGMSVQTLCRRATASKHLPTKSGMHRSGLEGGDYGAHRST